MMRLKSRATLCPSGALMQKESWVNVYPSSYLVDVPFLTSHIMHLKASAVFLYVHTLQSQNPSSEGFG